MTTDLENPVQGSGPAAHITKQLWCEFRQRLLTASWSTHAGWLILDRIVRLLVGLVVTAFLARHLGVSDYGMLASLIAICGLGSPLVNLAAQETYIHLWHANPDHRAELLGSSLVIRLIMGVGATLIGIMTVLLVMDDQHLALLAVLLSLPSLLVATDVLDFSMQAEANGKRSVIVRAAAFLIAACLRLLLIACEAPLSAFAAMATIEVSLSAICLIFGFGSWHGRVRPRWNPSIALMIAAKCWPLVISGVMIQIYMRLDQILVLHWCGPAEAGTYSANVRLAESWYFLPAALSSALIIPIVRGHLVQPDAIARRMQQAYSGMALLGWIAALGLIFAGPWAITVLFGQSFSSSPNILPILAWSGIFVAVGMARTMRIAAEVRWGFHAFSVIIGAVVSIGLNALLIPLWGAPGAAWATLGAYAMASVGSSLIWPSQRKDGWLMVQAILLIHPIRSLLARRISS